MPIAGAVVTAANSEGGQDLAGLLVSEAGVEVCGIGPAGIAIIVESDSMDGLTSLTKKIGQREDVADLRMTYCNWEDQG